jgi:hypothetical protein
MLSVCFERPMQRAPGDAGVLIQASGVSGIKKGPHWALVTRIAMFADGYPPPATRLLSTTIKLRMETLPDYIVSS